MTESKSCDIIISAKDRDVLCPACRAKLLRITPDTTAENLPIYCRKCKRELTVTVMRGQSARRRSP